MHWGLSGSVDVWGQQGYKWHQGALGTPRGVGVSGEHWEVVRGDWGMSGDVRVSVVHWGAGRECRYSGASRGIGGIRGS